MLDPFVLELARQPNFAVLTTLLADGHPQTHVMWVDATDVHLLINTQLGRQKHRNIERDPRVTVTIIDRDDPYRFAEVRGRVVGMVTGEPAADHIHALARKYTDEQFWNPTDRRVICQIAPLRQVLHR